MDQIGLALSRRKLPRKPFSRRVCLAGCALDSILPLLLPSSLPPSARHPSLLLSARVIILLLRNIPGTPVGLLPSHSKGNLTGARALGYVTEMILNGIVIVCTHTQRKFSNLNLYIVFIFFLRLKSVFVRVKILKY